ncbi:GntR family transcriptional regulator [Primorskyibacter sp. S187A]|uniref:GntR family transcriptional regulator n=1 Tax=Primorskyibacter sp. S187A TaxID=3415130 RepID=UPI003C7C1C2D
MSQALQANTIARQSLHHELVERLQTLIINSELAPGSKVPEKLLCDQFGVSRTPLREALKVLASYGLVRLEPNRGAWVTQVTEEEVEEVFPVLGALEALSGKLACRHITDEEIANIRTLHQQMLESYENRDLDAYFSINQKIHLAILEAARNQTLTTSSRALSLRMQRARYLANMTEGRWYDAVQEHEQILQFIEARDGPKLAAILSKHMDQKRVSVIRYLQENSSETSPATLCN